MRVLRAGLCALLVAATVAGDGFTAPPASPAVEMIVLADDGVPGDKPWD